MSAVPEQIGWLLDEFTVQAPDVRCVLVTSRDGMYLDSRGFSTDEQKETLSAVTSAYASLSKGVAKGFGLEPGFSHLLLQLAAGLQVIVMEAGAGALLTVVVEQDGHTEAVAHQMVLLIKRFPAELSVPDRLPATSTQ
jgi:predicted regulator of Ras-like GTPase activity (Roadblock/LC7/MglB family)